MNNYDRILVIKPWKSPAQLDHRGSVLEKYHLTNEQLDRLIETGGEHIYEGKKMYFDLPDARAYGKEN